MSFRYFENSPKRQKYSECFIELYKDELQVLEIKLKQIIDLSKTKWTERHHAYDSCYFLF